MELAKNYDAHENEEKILKFWEDNDIFKFDADSDKEVYSIDTPPPTVSGKMHIGHAFSYAQQDFIARFKRMRGFSVFYPFGTDDNGLATDRLVEKEMNVKSSNMERKEYVKLVLEWLDKNRDDFISDWKKIGMSCDFNIYYTTIDPYCQKIAQKSFIDLYNDGREYRKDAPIMWCPQCRTGVSQVEAEDKEIDSFFVDIIFKIEGEDAVIATTRPELLPACVAVFYHPDDERYKKYDGKDAEVPLFGFKVPVLPDKRADPEKGSGLVMCCTFGDQTDMEWQKAHNLPIKMAISEGGKMTDIAGKYKGMKLLEARKAMKEDMKEKGLLIDEKPIKHAVNVHERCGTEIEFIKSKQWFIKYLDLKQEMIEWGKELNWYPAHMRHRFDNWVKGLQWDWLISRQRHYGIPFPVWYCKECDDVIMADEKDLPVDPLEDKPNIDKCPKCGCTEFVPEKDVLDTWATSSLTPQICTGLLKGKPVYEKLYPMDLRPQAHDIITFWLFNTVVKSRLHNKVNPWKDVVISGHAQDPHGRKMSKSKGNIVVPQEMIKKFNADALRFWAAGTKLGDDLPFMEKDLVTANKIITKLWNASKFTMMHLEGYDNKFDTSKLEVIDKWILSKMHRLIKSCTETFDRYEFFRTKSETELFFWQTFCDNYLEISKHRLYNPDKYGEDARKSAQYTLYTILLNILKMFAPIMPFITEAIYQAYFMESNGEKSIHLTNWPEYYEKFVDADAESAGELAVYAIMHARRAKSEKGISLKEPISKMVLKSKLGMDAFRSVERDIVATSSTVVIEYEQLDKDSKIDFEHVIDI